MKTTTTKLSVLAFLGLGIAAYGQYEGKVGINTDKPKASLEIKSISANSSDTREGLLIPRVSKNKALLMGNNTTHPVEESTLIYVNDLSDYTAPPTSPDTKVADITEKGYYFWNGTKWVKSVGATNGNTGGALWAQRDNNSITETYLVPADTNGDFLGYKSNKKFSLKLGDSQGVDFSYQFPDGTQGYLPNSVPYSSIITSDVLPATNTLNGIGAKGNTFIFHNMNTVVKESHVSQNPQAVYVASENRTLIKDVTSNMYGLYGVNSSVDFFSNASTTHVIGISGVTSTGSKNGKYSSAKANSNIGGNFNARNYGTVTNAYGVRAFVNNWGNMDNITGIFTFASTQNSPVGTTTVPVHNVKKIYGFNNFTTIAENATVETESVGILNRNNINANSTTPLHIGIRNYSSLAQNATVTKLIGEQIFFYTDANSNVTEQYGLMIDNVNKGTDNNYAIYTKAGNVRFGDLAGTGTRNVVVDADGVLKTGEATGATQLTGTDGIECNEANRGKMNFKKDVAIGSGTGDAFGICLKGTDGNFYWRYLYGAGGVSNDTGVFGTGL